MIFLALYHHVQTLASKAARHTVTLVVTLLFSISFTSLGFAQGKIYKIGSNDYAAAVKTEQFVFSVARQNSQNWCWAACIQMVLQYQGLKVDQCEIVKKGLGMNSCIDSPADCYTIKQGVEGWYIKGKRIVAETSISKYADHSYDLVDQLAFKYPVIIGLNLPNQVVGHAYVLTAVFFQYDSWGNKIPYKVVLRDPWPHNTSRQEFEWQDFISRINCITYVNLK